MSVLLLILFASVYVLPGILASQRRHKQTGAIWAVNILLGWTFIGWVLALVWALTNEQRATA